MVDMLAPTVGQLIAQLMPWLSLVPSPPLSRSPSPPPRQHSPVPPVVPEPDFQPPVSEMPSVSTSIVSSRASSVAPSVVPSGPPSPRLHPNNDPDLPVPPADQNMYSKENDFSTRSGDLDWGNDDRPIGRIYFPNAVLHHYGFEIGPNWIVIPPDCFIRQPIGSPELAEFVDNDGTLYFSLQFHIGLNQFLPRPDSSRPNSWKSDQTLSLQRNLTHANYLP